MNEPRNDEVLAPPQVLLSKNPIHWLRFFGPGAIIASVTIGSGELLFPSRGGALFGYRILWLFAIFAFMKWLMAYWGMRHMVLSGSHPLERWSHVPGPRGWLPLFLMLILVVCLPIWFGFLAGALGTHCVWFFGTESHPIWGHPYAWATLWLAVAIGLLCIGQYDVLEKVQMGILGIMLLGVFAAVFYVQPDWLGILHGFFVPGTFEYPAWALEKYPDLAGRSVWAEVLIYCGAIGGSAHDYLGYNSFLRDKKWGRCHLEPATPAELETIAADPKHPARLWLRAAWSDSIVSMIMVIVIAAAFVILGKMILQPQQLLPEGHELLSHQANFLTKLSPVLSPLYGVAVFFAFFGILYGGPEVQYRAFYEYVRSIPGLRHRVSNSKLRGAVILWALVGGCGVLWLSDSKKLIELITPAGIYTGVVACGCYLLANPWADFRFLPRKLRLGKPAVALSVISGLTFLVLAPITLAVQYDLKLGLGLLAGGVAGSMVLARFLAPLYRATDDRKETP